MGDPDAARISRDYAEVCVSRAVEIKDQELRAFVVRHSVIRIHCVVVAAMLLLALGSWVGFAKAPGDLVVVLIGFSSLVIVASTRSIVKGVAHR